MEGWLIGASVAGYIAIGLMAAAVVYSYDSRDDTEALLALLFWPAYLVIGFPIAILLRLASRVSQGIR